MRTPCDEAVAQSTAATVPCAQNARSWVLAATILGSSMAFIDGTVVNVALPTLQASFHATVVDLQWVVESYGVLLAALILVGGSFGDRFGRRLDLIAGVLIFALASAGCGLAQNIHQLIGARSIQGVGAALLVPGSLAIISTSFDGEEIEVKRLVYGPVSRPSLPRLGRFLVAGWFSTLRGGGYSFSISRLQRRRWWRFRCWRIPESRSSSLRGG